jgi:hypothetical protein
VQWSLLGMSAGLWNKFQNISETVTAFTITDWSVEITRDFTAICKLGTLLGNDKQKRGTGLAAVNSNLQITWQRDTTFQRNRFLHLLGKWSLPLSYTSHHRKLYSRWSPPQEPQVWNINQSRSHDHSPFFLFGFTPPNLGLAHNPFPWNFRTVLFQPD